MPVILAPQDHAAWLACDSVDPATLKACLRPYPSDQMAMFPVSTVVNNPRHESPECVVPRRVTGTRPRFGCRPRKGHRQVSGIRCRDWYNPVVAKERLTATTESSLPLTLPSPHRGEGTEEVIFEPFPVGRRPQHR